MQRGGYHAQTVAEKTWTLIYTLTLARPSQSDWRAPAQLSNVMGCLTTYGIGSAPPYFGAGYVPQAKWYQLGFLLSVFYIAVWLGVGGVWWKAIGLW